MPETTSPAYEIARYLEGEGAGVWAPDAAASDWHISVAQSGDRPDTTIVLQDEGGGEPDTGELDIQDFTLHVRVRSAKGDGYNAAYAKQAEIRELLIQPSPLVTANMYFIGARMVGNIANLGRDQNDRHILMATYQLQRQMTEEPTPTPEPEVPEGAVQNRDLEYIFNRDGEYIVNQDVRP